MGLSMISLVRIDALSANRNEHGEKDGWSVRQYSGGNINLQASDALRSLFQYLCSYSIRGVAVTLGLPMA